MLASVPQTVPSHALAIVPQNIPSQPSAPAPPIPQNITSHALAPIPHNITSQPTVHPERNPAPSNTVKFPPEKIRQIESDAAKARRIETARTKKKVPDKSDAAAMNDFFNYMDDAHNETLKIIEETNKVLGVETINDEGNNNSDVIMGDETAHKKRTMADIDEMDDDDDDL